MREPTVVVKVRVPVLPYRSLSYRAGRQLLMPVSDARRLAERGCVELLEAIGDDAEDVRTEQVPGTTPRRRSAGQDRGKVPIRLVRLTGRFAVECDICSPDGAPPTRRPTCCSWPRPRPPSTRRRTTCRGRRQSRGGEGPLSRRPAGRR